MRRRGAPAFARSRRGGERPEPPAGELCCRQRAKAGVPEQHQRDGSEVAVRQLRALLAQAELLIGARGVGMMVGVPMMQIVGEFEASAKQYPLIQPGTLDPYSPPRAR